MKVLDLQCHNSHVFEGWFASEEDFVAQRQRGLVQCPLCGDPAVVKMLSAPRLSLSGSRDTEDSSQHIPQSGANPQVAAAAWLAVARHVMSHTIDVGAEFADVARSMHYGETEPRGIRGTATPQQTRELVDEGIEAIPMLLPNAVKETLQ